ncbi:MAG: hypothetical protein MUC87_10010 [Bacteroidia bacterium]|jgi:hypothetical protein|nr:hypothetical protein [Bacteroidia bacterium]
MDTPQIPAIAERISNSIRSSITLLQLETTERLLALFCAQQTAYPELNEKLRAEFARKAENLHYFEWKRFRELGADAA